MKNQEKAAEIAKAVADRFHRPRKPGAAPQRYAIIYQAAYYGAIAVLNEGPVS